MFLRLGRKVSTGNTALYSWAQIGSSSGWVQKRVNIFTICRSGAVVMWDRRDPFSVSYNEKCPKKKVRKRSQNISVCIQEQCSHWSSREQFLYPLTHPFSFCYSSTQWWELRCLVIGVGIKIHLFFVGIIHKNLKLFDTLPSCPQTYLPSFWWISAQSNE